MHIERLELSQLRLLEAIAQQGSLSAAAEAVGLSQSAASHSLARLRREADDVLFVRTAQRMQPTPYGEQLCNAVRQALTLLREGLRDDARGFLGSASSRTFTLLMSEAGQLVMLPTLLDHLKHAAPKVRIRVGRVLDRNAGEPVETGAADLAIGHITSMTTGFHRRMLFHEHYVCIACAGNPRFAQGMSLEAYTRADHALADASGMAHWLLDQQLQQQGIVRRVGLVVPEFLALPFLIPGSEFVATVPSRVAERFARLLPLKVMPLPIALAPYEIFMFWHERTHTDPANRWLRATLVELLGDTGGVPR